MYRRMYPMRITSTIALLFSCITTIMNWQSGNLLHGYFIWTPITQRWLNILQANLELVLSFTVWLVTPSGLIQMPPINPQSALQTPDAPFQPAPPAAMVKAAGENDETEQESESQ